MNKDNISVIEIRIAHLQAENESLKNLLQEYGQLAILKANEQRDLQEQVSAAVAVKSSLEGQVEQVQMLKYYINEMMQKAEAALERETGLENQVSLSVSTSYRLEEIKTQYNYLLVQLNDLSERLQQMNSQNILQQQYASRVAELESLLANAQEEIEGLKNNSGNTG